MPWMKERQPQPIEKFMSVVCYLTAGLGGILYIALGGASSNTKFFRFHFLQAILIGVLGALVAMTGNILVGIVGSILSFIPALPMETTVLILQMLGTLVAGMFVILLLYGLINAALGRYAEIPVISRIVRQQMN